MKAEGTKREPLPVRLTACLRAQMAWARSSRSELAIGLAVACLILVLTDVAAIAALERLAPALAADLQRVDRDRRVALIGLPAALVFLASALFLNCRSLRRTNRGHG